MPVSRVEHAIDDIKSGRMVIIVDDEDRENEGDLVMAAEMVTPDAINFMATHGRGLVCVPMLGTRLEELGLPLMVQDNTARHSTAFTVSVDALSNATTGISAYDRSVTIQALINPDTTPQDLARPGHIFPLRYMEGGVLVRAGQTEASVDLTRLASLYPASIICEIMSDDGTMARMDDLEHFSNKFDIKIVTVADLITYRRRHEKMIERIAEARIPTDMGEFTAISYISRLGEDGSPGEVSHIAFVMGEISTDEPTLVRVHSECLTGDVFGSIRCDCGDQMKIALNAISEEGTGVFLYMRQEGRGIGLHNKLKAYNLQDQGLDTVEANIRLGFDPDPRNYGVGAQILEDLGVRKLRLLTNNPSKRVGLESFGLELEERVPIIAATNEENKRYLQTKKDKLGHLLDSHS